MVYVDSEKRQLKAARDYCDRNGLELDENGLADRGRSGFKGDHLKEGADLGDFLTAVKSGKIPAGTPLVVENLDRLSRQGIDKTTDLLKDLTKAGIDVHIVGLNRVLKANFNNSLIDYVIIGVQADLANQESTKKSERLRSARLAEKEKAAVDKLAFTARVPSWLKAEIGHKAVVIEERAATVRRIFQLAADGIGAKTIVNTLIAEGRQPFSNGSQGKAWSHGFIQKILQNRSVLGHFQPHRLINGKRVPEGAEIEGLFPKVVTQSLFEAAQEQVKRKNHNPDKTPKIDSKGRLNSGGGNVGGGKHGVTSLLSPLVWDGDRRMVFHQKKGDRPYLMTSWKSGMPTHFVRYDRLETAFLSFLENLNWREVAGQGESAEVKSATAQLETALVDIDRSSQRIAQLQKLVDEGTFSASLFAALDAEKAKLVDASNRKDKLTSEVSRARSKLQALYSPEALIEAIKAGNPELRLKLKNEIARRVSRIDIQFDGKVPTGATITFINAFKGFILFQ